MKRTLLVLALAAASAAQAWDMEMFTRQDYDRDGFVDQVEVMGAIDLQGRFNDIDVDRDGRISAAEMQAWIDKPDKLHPMRDTAPLRVHEQWREIERRRAEQAQPPADAQGAAVTSAPSDAQPPRSAP